MERVKIADIIERQGDNKYSLLLLEEQGHRAFVVNIGLNEAWGIIAGMKKIELPRPTTYQLMLNILNTTNLKLKEVNITETIDKIFYAQVKFLNNREEIIIDARPSDGVALAVLMNAPIYVSIQVLDEFSFHVPEKYWGTEPNQNGIMAIIGKLTKKRLESEIQRKTKNKIYTEEITKEIINQVFSN